MRASSTDEEAGMRIAVAGASGLIGSQVVRHAEENGHEVVPLGRTQGFDLTAPPDGRLARRLEGADAVIDVTRSPSMEERAATAFFEAVARTLGEAATRAGVARTVVLSIVGVEEGQDFGWYVATLAHEQATRRHGPGAVAVRTTQFHEFPGQVLARGRRGDRVAVMDVPLQPVDSAEVARLLVEAATAPEAHDRQLAGPRQERLVDLARALVEHDRLGITVDPVPAVASMAGGSMLPGPDVLVRGPDWRTWLSHRA